MSDRSIFIVLALAAGLVVSACGGGASQQQAQPANQPAATTAAAAGAQFGVPECDEYIAKYVACIDSKVPESARAMVRQQLDQTKAQWQQAASAPGGKEGLAMGCKAATDAARTAMSAYGCQF